MTLLNPSNWFRRQVWRKHSELGEKFNKWDEDTVKKLKSYIQKETSGKAFNILFIGAIDSGKSSTINSFFTIINGRISCRANSGSIGVSFTTKYTQIPGEKEFSNICFYDTSGIEEINGTSITDLNDAVNGYKTLGDNFVEQESAKDKEENEKGIEENENGIEENERGKEENKKGKEKNENIAIHCIIYVLDAENVRNGLKKCTMDKLGDFSKNQREGPPRVVFLTKVDTISSDVRKDNKLIYSCKHVHDTVTMTAALMSVDEGIVYPVRNYVTDQDLSSEITIPFLLALSKVVGFAKDYQKGTVSNNRFEMSNAIKD